MGDDNSKNVDGNSENVCQLGCQNKAPAKGANKKQKSGEPRCYADNWDATEEDLIKHLKSYSKKTLIAKDGSTSVEVYEFQPLLTSEHKVHVPEEKDKKGKIIPAHDEHPLTDRTNKDSKDFIVLHWTSGLGTHPEVFLEARFTVPYYVGRSGAIFHYFDEGKYWSAHCNNGNRRSIGIEHANAGQLFTGPHHGKKKGLEGYLYHEDIAVYCRMSDKDKWEGPKDLATYGGTGTRYYAKLTEKQMGATQRLVRYLCAQYDIPANALPENKRATHLTVAEIAKYKGILSHFNCTSNEGHDDEMLQFDWSLFTRCLTPS